MEPEWMQWLRDNMPADLFEDFEKDRSWSAEWRDDSIRKLRQWIGDLQSGMYINCVYCGHRYGPKDQVPSSMANVLKEHIKTCPQHPMSSLVDLIKSLEWSVDSEDVDGFPINCCPSCGSRQDDGHYNSCPMIEILHESVENTDE